MAEDDHLIASIPDVDYRKQPRRRITRKKRVVSRPTTPRFRPPRWFVIVHSDGGHRASRWIAAWGAVVKDGQRRILIEAAGALTEDGVTSNEAEYIGMMEGIRIAHEFSPLARIHVYADSLLVVQQMTGNWVCRSPVLRKLRDKALAYIDSEAIDVDFFWVPRGENKDADRMCNEMMDAALSLREVDPYEQPKPIYRRVG